MHIRVLSINIDTLVISICVHDSMNWYTRFEHKYSFAMSSCVYDNIISHTRIEHIYIDFAN